MEFKIPVADSNCRFVLGEVIPEEESNNDEDTGFMDDSIYMEKFIIEEIDRLEIVVIENLNIN